MTKDNSSLGKGLGSLLGDRPKQQVSGLTEIATEDLTPGQYQPRKKMYRDTLEELAESIKQQGVLQPLVARRLREEMESGTDGGAQHSSNGGEGFEQQRNG